VTNNRQLTQHELDEDAVCVKCGFDATEWWHLERMKDKPDRQPQPICERRIQRAEGGR
jgi:hypothetical protein